MRLARSILPGKRWNRDREAVQNRICAAQGGPKLHSSLHFGELPTN